MKLAAFLLSILYLAHSNGQGITSNEQNQLSEVLATASLEDAGFNPDSIENLIDLINQTTHKDFRGLVVIKDNHIVIEEYFNTFWRNTILDIRSAGKSITALLLGTAIKEGLIESLDQSVYALFSKDKNPHINEEYDKISLRHLLNMSSGLDADTNDPLSTGHAGKWIGKDNWKEYLLNVPLKSEPGQEFVYADINPLLIGLAIEEASGVGLRDYAQNKLFEPLGIKQFYWYTNANNQTGAAGNLYLTTLDFAKLGLLITNDGKWGQSQLLDSEYIDQLINSKDLLISNRFPLADSYGMFWYKSSRNFGKSNIDYLFASGNGGNHLVVFPKFNMVIALTSSSYGQGYAHGRSFAIMEKILTALE